MPESFMKDPNVSAKWKLYGIINGFWLNRKTVYASNQYFSKEIGCSERAIISALGELESAGMIRRNIQGHNREIFPGGSPASGRGEAQLHAEGEAQLQPIASSNASSKKAVTDSEIGTDSSGEEDIRYVAEDEEGNPLTRNGFQRRPKSAGPAKNVVALRISHSFEERAKKVRPSVHVPTGKAYLLALGAMKQGLTEPQIYNLFDDWFANEPEEKAVNIGGALSMFNINRFKVRENL
jgi:hypothetical protein